MTLHADSVMDLIAYHKGINMKVLSTRQGNFMKFFLRIEEKTGLTTCNNWPSFREVSDYSEINSTKFSSTIFFSLFTTHKIVFIFLELEAIRFRPLLKFKILKNTIISYEGLSV